MNAEVKPVPVEEGIVPVSKIKPVPKVGETLVVLHEVKRSSDGGMVTLQRNRKPEYTKITAVYLDGSVRNNHTDVWEVKPGKLGQWETINPQREEAINQGRI